MTHGYSVIDEKSGEVRPPQAARPVRRHLGSPIRVIVWLPRCSKTMAPSWAASCADRRRQHDGHVHRRPATGPGHPVPPPAASGCKAVLLHGGVHRAPLPPVAPPGVSRPLQGQDSGTRDSHRPPGDLAAQPSARAERPQARTCPGGRGQSWHANRTTRAWNGSIIKLAWCSTVLERSPFAGNTVVAYTTDHGENLGEHGLWWKNCLYDSGRECP